MFIPRREIADPVNPLPSNPFYMIGCGWVRGRWGRLSRPAAQKGLQDEKAISIDPDRPRLVGLVRDLSFG